MAECNFTQRLSYNTHCNVQVNCNLMVMTKVWDLYFNGADTLTRLNTELINSSRANCREEALIFQPRREGRRMVEAAVKTSGAEHIMQNRAALVVAPPMAVYTHQENRALELWNKKAWHLPILPLNSLLYIEPNPQGHHSMRRQILFVLSWVLAQTSWSWWNPPPTPPRLQLSACSDGIQGVIWGHLHHIIPLKIWSCTTLSALLLWSVWKLITDGPKR